MDTERWRRIESLFNEAWELSEPARRAFLDERCGGDPTLRRDLARMLGSSGSTPGTMPGGAPGAAAGAPPAATPGAMPRSTIDSLRSAIATEFQAIATSAAADQLNRRIGPSRLIRLIGRGGMGAVYLAERDDQQFVHRVAIKLLPHAVGSPATIARFRDERQFLAALKHQNIVRLVDGGSTDDDLPYLVMEYIEGTTITRYANEHQLSVRARVELIRQVCGGLQYAHQNLVVHRDIKPSNILVDAGGIPKILDFGIAKLLAPVHEFEREALTRTGFAMFTPEYASPEQARGDVISTATDVYSVGAVLYELVTGRPPLRVSGSALEILETICKAEPPRPSAVAPSPHTRELVGDLDNIILKALHKDLAHRYASVEQLSDDLGRWLDGLPVHARTSTLRYRAHKFVTRNKAMVAAITVVIATLLAATIVSLDQARRADEQAVRALEEARRAQNETDRARKAEAERREQLDQLRAEQARRAEAEAVAQDKTSEAGRSKEQLQVALARAEREKQIAEQEKRTAEQESAKAREAETRAEEAARTEKTLRQDLEVMLQKERERNRVLEEARKRITNQLP
jgi:serine/threonine protein kinase